MTADVVAVTGLSGQVVTELILCEEDAGRRLLQANRYVGAVVTVIPGDVAPGSVTLATDSVETIAMAVVARVPGVRVIADTGSGTVPEPFTRQPTPQPTVSWASRFLFWLWLRQYFCQATGFC
jgi:hypothetical protein